VGHQVVGIELDPKRAVTLNQGIPPLFEPGLEELMTRHLRSGRLQYLSDLQEAAKDASHVIIAYDTPVNEDDEPDLSSIIDAVEALARCMRDGVTIILSSQVPVGTCEKLATVLRRLNPQLRFGIACVPENLRLGQAIDRFLHPDMLVIGADSEDTIMKVEALYARLDAPRIRGDLRTAEMTKHAINAYLATCISLGNDLGNLCDEVGADAFQVIQALKLDSRVSQKAPLLPGLGFAGGTLARDMKVLTALASRHQYAAHVLNGVLAVNRFQNSTIVHRLERFVGSLRGKAIGVLGLTYKPETSTLRRSVAVEIIRAITARGATVSAYDPKADPVELTGFQQEFAACADPYAVARGAHALVLVTAWPEFKELDFPRLRSAMVGSVFLDAANMLDPEQIAKAGFLYQGIGRTRGFAPWKEPISP
jgi:UDPglucose 6-dehydrogenase